MEHDFDFEPTRDDADVVEPLAPTHGVLFENDTGALPEDTRRVLVKLLTGPTLDGRRHTKLWPVMLRDEKTLRSRLHELFLALVIDRDQEVAFVRQVETEAMEVPVLLRTARLTFMESALLLYLRERLLLAEGQGERAVVSEADMLEQLRMHGNRGSTDHHGTEKRYAAAITKLKKHSVLNKLRNSDDRYEVSPVLKLLFSIEQVKELTRQYKALAAKESAAAEEGLSDEEKAALRLAADRRELDAVLAAEEAALADDEAEGLDDEADDDPFDDDADTDEDR